MKHFTWIRVLVSVVLYLILSFLALTRQAFIATTVCIRNNVVFFFLVKEASSSHRSIEAFDQREQLKNAGPFLKRYNSVARRLDGSSFELCV